MHSHFCLFLLSKYSHEKQPLGMWDRSCVSAKKFHAAKWLCVPAKTTPNEGARSARSRLVNGFFIRFPTHPLIPTLSACLSGSLEKKFYWIIFYSLKNFIVTFKWTVYLNIKYLFTHLRYNIQKIWIFGDIPKFSRSDVESIFIFDWIEIWQNRPTLKLHTVYLINFLPGNVLKVHFTTMLHTQWLILNCGILTCMPTSCDRFHNWLYFKQKKTKIWYKMHKSFLWTR